MKTLIIGSRRSTLAQIQSQLVCQGLIEAWPDLTVQITLIDTRGDLNRRDPLPQIGGKGLFTLELEEALRQKQIDLAVHSLKDLPVEDSPGLGIIAIPQRAAVHDVLVSYQVNRIEDLAGGAVVGTSSLRRAAQILAVRPDVQIKDIRGNVDTRLQKLEDATQGYDAIVLAQAGLNRLGHTQLAYAHPIPFSTMLPAPGQGALGIQGRANDRETNHFLEALNHLPTRLAVTAERAFLAGLGGGCSLPVGALAAVSDGQLQLQGVIASATGQNVIRVEVSGPVESAERLSQQLVEKALKLGADRLLKSQSK